MNPSFPKIKILFLGILLFSVSFAEAQVSPNLGQTDRWMKGALAAMEQRDYQTANSIFRNLIDSGVPLPDEMPYFFSETLFELGQYDNSSNFLNKYLELTGFKGENYEGAKELQARLKQPIAAILACNLCDRRGYRFQTCFTCDGNKQIEQVCDYCKSKGIVGCSRCTASGMIKKVNVFNIVEFFECERCSGKGRLTCPECTGSGKEISDCKTCSGSGKITSDALCDHIPHVHESEPVK
ncbi:tetratricopeptide repeat protein [Algoriphagus sp. A40]|uniref:tetratricopeptide repeat protein n=1 Tax=Algoriphagus sp. A40 TaxID=1945863 RepID=UPI00098685E8|nr:tetratricopeptide repeat protein [Algoriphagus sp. A40]OOG73816.1 molecular chaperone DnaJ [Algoriphagus sp. A40]